MDPRVSLTEAIAHIDQALEALWQIPVHGEIGIRVDDLATQLQGIAVRLHALQSGKTTTGGA